MPTIDKSTVNAYFTKWHENYRLAPYLVPRLVAIFEWFESAGLCERKFETEIRKGTYVSYAQDMSEMLVAYRLHQDGYTLRRSSSSGGPDFVATKENASIQLEIVTPQALPDVAAYIGRPRTGVFSIPLNSFLLCWTKGIAQKAGQLLGNGDIKGWVEKGLVDARLPFVVVVNGCSFKADLSEGFRQPAGKLPCAAVGLYAVSDLTIYVDRSSLKSIGSGFEYRDKLARDQKGAVPLDTFLDPQYQPISAVWALTLNDYDLLHDDPQVLPRRDYESAVLHNPMANVPLIHKAILAFEEWVLHASSTENTLERIVNRLPPPPSNTSGP